MAFPPYCVYTMFSNGLTLLSRSFTLRSRVKLEGVV